MRLGRRFAGEPKRQLARLIKRHTLRSEFLPAQQTMNQFARLAVLLKTGRVAARLVIEQDELSTPTNFSIIAKVLGLCGDRPAVHADPNAIWPAGSFGDLVVQIPNFEPPLVIPLNPFSIALVPPVLLARDHFTGPIAESLLAIFTKARAASAEAAPTVVGKSFRAITLDNFAQDSR